MAEVREYVSAQPNWLSYDNKDSCLNLKTGKTEEFTDTRIRRRLMIYTGLKAAARSIEMGSGGEVIIS